VGYEFSYPTTFALSRFPGLALASIPQIPADLLRFHRKQGCPAEASARSNRPRAAGFRRFQICSGLILKINEKFSLILPRYAQPFQRKVLKRRLVQTSTRRWRYRMLFKHFIEA